MEDRNIYYLHELKDYKVASDYPDVRGWEVKDTDKRTIGTVDNLLVNKKAERVVYLDVEVDSALIEEGHNTYQTPASEGVHSFLNQDGENHLIIPIGMADLDEKSKLVTTNQIDSSTFAKTKRFRKGDAIGFDYELNVVRHYKGDNTIHSSDLSDGFYNREEFDNSIHRRDSD
jgi:hypothetical protein